MKKSLPVCRGALRRLIASPHCWVIAILSVLYMENVFEPFRAYLKEINGGISILGLMTVYMNDPTVSAFMALGCLGLLFNAPCSDQLQRYLLLRCGRRSWVRGQIMYAAVVCFGYLLLLTFIVFLLAQPYFEPTLDWGTSLVGFYDDFAYETYNSLVNYDIWIPRVYSCIGAFSLQFLLHFGAYFMLSILMADINLIVDRRLGFAVVAVPIALDMLLQEYFGTAVSYASPLTLCRLSGLDYGDEMGRPSFWIALAIFAGCAALFSLIQSRYAHGREVFP